MIGAIKNIMNMINVEASNLAGSNINGYKKKTASIDSSGNDASGIGNDFYTKTDYKQGNVVQTGQKSDLAIQGNGFFVLFDGNQKSSFDPNQKISNLNRDKTFSKNITSGTFTVNGNAVVVDVNNDSYNDVLNKISMATFGEVTGTYNKNTNSLTLVNNSGIPNSDIVFGTGTSNFLDVSAISDSIIQKGISNKNFKESSLPVGVMGQNTQVYFTRKGDFNFDSNGFLVNNQGLFVAGIDERTGNLMKIDKKAFDGSGSPSDEINFSPNGMLFNNTQLVKEGKQLALANITNKNGLVASRFGGEILSATENAGRIKIDSPDKSSLDLVRDQSLEQSNSSSVESLTNLGVLERFFPSTVNALKVTLSTQDDLNKFIQ